MIFFKTNKNKIILIAITIVLVISMMVSGAGKEKAGIVSNTFGSVTNIRLGPLPSASGVPPENVNTAGIIISPAKSATPVSKISIRVMDLPRLSFLSTYEP